MTWTGIGFGFVMGVLAALIGELIYTFSGIARMEDELRELHSDDMDCVGTNGSYE